MYSHFVLKNRIKYFRLMFDLTQSQLASLAGVSKNTISSLECNVFTPSARLACILCDLFDCNFEDCFYLEQSSSSSGNLIYPTN